MGCYPSLYNHLFGEDMSDAFHLVDLVSQASAVRRLLSGMTNTEMLAWLSSKGQVDAIPSRYPDQKQAYHFTSVVNREAMFFFDGGDLVFLPLQECSGSFSLSGIKVQSA